MTWTKLIIDHLQFTVDILDGIRAEPDALLAIGAAVCKLEDVIEILKTKGGTDGMEDTREAVENG